MPRYKMLTKLQKAALLQRRNYCPLCRRESLTLEDSQWDENGCSERIVCRECGRRFELTLHYTAADDRQEFCAVCELQIRPGDDVAVIPGEEAAALAHAHCTTP